MEDTNFSVPLTPLSYFEDHLLPREFLDHFDVDAVVEELRKMGQIDDNGRWTLFPQDPHLCDGLDEDSVFKPLTTLAQLVGTGARQVYRDAHGLQAKVPSQSVEWRCNPRMTPLSTKRLRTDKPDIYSVLMKRTVKGPRFVDNGEPHWDDIVVPGETKKHRTNANFNDVRLGHLFLHPPLK